ncbi:MULTISPECIES: nucleotidyltransferase [unclassified Staphylococcus]|uniref:nucleotidyltransferase n=1 Tax=unclassified Staphylococcus TaxID=91994 RepID=UPI0021D18716|nr:MULTISPECIES: nucleotidyltransferase [unclassified Staphylococcus]UXR79369.1 nucleotidyltransferase [Staphylococcus sp. IVB6227]UXR83504.1 nucleotidyltransferase [Staphylococcus sp. IVB6214]
MKSVALITEYNPFHNGHLYHAHTAKQMTQSDVTIAIMSGHFVMRGMPAMFNKFQRARMALAGVDLVIELPVIGSLSSSDYFAKMGVLMADYLSADALCFGSESGNIDHLQQAATQLLSFEETAAYHQAIKEGKSYARIVSESIGSTMMREPNNILGIAYLKQLQSLNSSMIPYTVQRQHTQHHQQHIDHETFASGSAIRESLINNDTTWHNMIPASNRHLLNKPFHDQQRLFEFLKLTIYQQNTHSLSRIYTMSEGFEHRLINCIKTATSYDDLMQQLKTKRYTYTHIQRVLMNVLLNISKDDVTHTIDAARVLAMSKQGQAYLKWLKQTAPDRQIITNINQSNASLFTNEVKATNIYNVLTGHTETDFNTPVIIDTNNKV